jgi:CheY-like chemotaxis protein
MLRREILLIDDDQDDLDNFIDAIESLKKNVSCHALRNPLKALEELAGSEKKPDLIFLDYNMPYINGMEFLRKMRSCHGLEGIEVVVFSTPEENVMLPWLIKNGISVKYRSKPDTFEELKALLGTML